MHPLFVEVLSKKDLSRAGELFAIDDRAIVKDLSELLATIKKISNSPYYIDRHNDQSVVEICLTRIISAIRYILFRNLNTKIPISNDSVCLFLFVLNFCPQRYEYD